MSQNQIFLDLLIKSLLLEPKQENRHKDVADKIRGHWKNLLKSIFPGTFLVLGESADEVVDEYFDRFPPRNWNPLLFGSELPIFLKELSLTRRAKKYSFELADFEWSKFWVLRAPKFEPVGEGYHHNPYIRSLKLRYNIIALLKAPELEPELKSELIFLTRNSAGELLIFEPTLLESAVYDMVHEGASSRDQIIASVSKSLPGSDEDQIERALNDLVLKGVLVAPSLVAKV